MNYDENDERIPAELLSLQMERENASLAAGRDRFLASIEQAAKEGVYARTQVGREICHDWLEPLEHAIRDWQLSTVKARPGPKRLSEELTKEWLNEIGPLVAAFITLTTVMDTIALQEDYRQVCLEVAARVQRELHLRQAACGNLKTTTEQRVQFGGVLLDLLCDSTHLAKPVTVKDESRNDRDVVILQPTPETEKRLQARTECLALHQAYKQPMVVPPLPWAPGHRGGYHGALKGEYPLVRRRWKTREIQDWTEQLERVAMPSVYKALNALQDTKWRINRPVYHLVEAIRNRGGLIAGLPKTEPYTLPRKCSKRTKSEIREKNAQVRRVERVLNATKSVLDLTIWFPYSLDFRGRMYPIPDTLNPQGDDLSKALLTFAQGKPLDEIGERRLAIHGANRLGKTPSGEKVSKMTLDERVTWIRANTDLLVRVADDPFGSLWWANAEQVDDPLQFYAFCVEWRNVQRAKKCSEVYASTLPVSIDGSCNGLQHFSALFRDENGAAQVNLVYGGSPQDMYERVAEKVREKLEQRRLTEPLAAKILDAKVVERNAVKRPTMTFFYSARRFAKQIREEWEKREKWSDIKAQFGSEAWNVCVLLAQLIEEVIPEIVKKASEGMTWLQKCARTIVKAGRSPEWTLPSGFGVRQVYPETKRTRVKTTKLASGKYRQVSLLTPTDKRDAEKHAKAIAPNVIHSFDGAALAFTLEWAADAGVESFAAAHDCFMTLAADCEIVHRFAGQAFSRLYTSHDPTAPAVRRGSPTVMLQALQAAFQAQADGADVDLTPPASGTLDLNAWLASDYLFS